MAKARFDRGRIIDSAIELFWKNGYNGSSMQQVMDATGLKSGSIYYSFGNKEALFREALEQYARSGMERIRKAVNRAPSVGAGICAHLERLAKEAGSKGFKSCFLVKTQLELAAESSELSELAADKLQQVEDLFQQYLEQEYGEALSRERAASIMLHIFGMRVYGCRRDSVESMCLALRQGLPWLPW